MSRSAAPAPRRARAYAAVRFRIVARFQSRSPPGRRRWSTTVLAAPKTALLRLCRLRSRPPVCHPVAWEPQVRIASFQRVPTRANTLDPREGRGHGLSYHPVRLAQPAPIGPGVSDTSGKDDLEVRA